MASCNFQKTDKRLMCCRHVGAVKQSSQLCTSINVYFILLLHQHIFSSFLSSNFYYTSIISIRTESGRIHLNKTNFAAIIEKTREMLFQDTTVWRTTEFQWFRQSQNTRYSTSSNRYNIYREKYPKNVFIFCRFFVSPFSQDWTVQLI